MADETLLSTVPAAEPTHSADPAATAAADGATEGEKAQEAAAPEAYELKAPEGREFDEGVLGAFTDVARELNLSNEAAQKVLDKIAPALAEKVERGIAETRAQWAEQSRSDTEFGGKALEENLGVARKALDSFGTPALRELLDSSGLGNHPEVIRLLVRAGRAISEDKMVTGSGTNPPADPRGLYAASGMNP